MIFKCLYISLDTVRSITRHHHLNILYATTDLQDSHASAFKVYSPEPKV